MLDAADRTDELVGDALFSLDFEEVREEDDNAVDDEDTLLAVETESVRDTKSVAHAVGVDEEKAVAQLLSVVERNAELLE